MIQVKGNILDVQSGVIVHQVNCQNMIGAGVSGDIIRKYPQVEVQYHSLFEYMYPEELLGKWQLVQIKPGLMVVNLFGQLEYGNPRKTGKVYTDVPKLVNALTEICRRFGDIGVYIPYGIGCGYGGARWRELEQMIRGLSIVVVKKG